MANSTIHVKGMEEVGRMLKQLPTLVKERVAARAVLEGAKVVRDEAIMRAPQDTGLLRANIRVAKRSRGVPDLSVKYVVFVRAGKKTRGKSRGGRRGGSRAATRLPYYWYFLEFGTSKMAARPFLLPAFAARVQDAANTSRDYARSRSEREFKKLRQK